MYLLRRSFQEREAGGMGLQANKKLATCEGAPSLADSTGNTPVGSRCCRVLDASDFHHKLAGVIAPCMLQIHHCALGRRVLMLCTDLPKVHSEFSNIPVKARHADQAGERYALSPACPLFAPRGPQQAIAWNVPCISSWQVIAAQEVQDVLQRT